MNHKEWNKAKWVLDNTDHNNQYNNNNKLRYKYRKNQCNNNRFNKNNKSSLNHNNNKELLFNNKCNSTLSQWTSKVKFKLFNTMK